MQLSPENQEKLIIGFLAASCVLLLIHLGQMMSSKKEGFGATGRPGQSAHLRGPNKILGQSAHLRVPPGPGGQSAHLRVPPGPGGQSAHLRGAVGHNMPAHLRGAVGHNMSGHLHGKMNKADKSMIQFQHHIRGKPQLD